MIVTIKLKLPDPADKTHAIIALGEVAQVLTVGTNSFELIEMTDDFAPRDGLGTAQKARKPRGPNKAKTMTPEQVFQQMQDDTKHNKDAQCNVTR